MLALRLAISLTLAAAASPAQEYRALAVDAEKVTGDIRFYTEAVLRPNPRHGQEYGRYASFGDKMPHRVVIPVALGGEKGGPPGQRMWSVFADEKADPQDPANYDFDAFDAILKALEGQELSAAIRFHVPDSDKESAANIAEAARQVVMHLNRRGAQGHDFRIREWSVCALDAPEDGEINPDRSDPNSLTAITAEVVKGLRRHDPSSAVGSCLRGSLGSRDDAGFHEETDAAIQGLDFASLAFPRIIEQATDPLLTVQRLRKALDNAGRARMQLRLLSPVMGLEGSARSGSEALEQAATLAAALIDLQGAPVASVALDLWSEPTGIGDEKRQAVLRAAAELSETPHRLTATGADSVGYALLAGRSEDRTSVGILIANHTRRSRLPQRSGQTAAGDTAPKTASQTTELTIAADGAEAYDLHVSNLPWGAADFGVYCYRVDDQHDLELVWQGGGRGGSFRLRRQLPAPAVELIVLQYQERPVYDRLPRRRDRR